MPGGALFGRDWEDLRASVLRVADRFPNPLFIEIGVAEGKTSRDLIAEIMANHGPDFYYIGIDPSPPPFEHPNYGHIQGTSDAASPIARKLIHQGTHWVFIDGCHCSQCVIRDAILFGTVPGGEMCLHDSCPAMQGREPQIHPLGHSPHSEAVAMAGIGVRQVLWLIEGAGHEMISDADPAQAMGGVTIFRKVSS